MWKNREDTQKKPLPLSFIKCTKNSSDKRERKIPQDATGSGLIICVAPKSCKVTWKKRVTDSRAAVASQQATRQSNRQKPPAGLPDTSGRRTKSCPKSFNAIITKLVKLIAGASSNSLNIHEDKSIKLHLLQLLKLFFLHGRLIEL